MDLFMYSAEQHLLTCLECSTRQTQINSCLPIISCDSNKQIQFPKQHSKSRYLAALAFMLYFPEHKAIIFS